MGPCTAAAPPHLGKSLRRPSGNFLVAVMWEVSEPGLTLPPQRPAATCPRAAHGLPSNQSSRNHAFASFSIFPSLLLPYMYHVGHYAMGGEQAVEVQQAVFVPPPPPAPPGVSDGGLQLPCAASCAAVAVGGVASSKQRSLVGSCITLRWVFLITWLQAARTTTRAALAGRRAASARTTQVRLLQCIALVLY